MPHKPVYTHLPSSWFDAFENFRILLPGRSKCEKWQKSIKIVSPISNVMWLVIVLSMRRISSKTKAKEVAIHLVWIHITKQIFVPLAHKPHKQPAQWGVFLVLDGFSFKNPHYRHNQNSQKPKIPHISSNSINTSNLLIQQSLCWNSKILTAFLFCWFTELYWERWILVILRSCFHLL